MGIKLKDDTHRGIKFNSYNKLNRIESLDLTNGVGSIRMAKYSSKKHREESPGDLLENRDFHTIELNKKDLKGLQDIVYKYMNELEEYKEGIKV